ncbi:hypothetical protein KAR91_21220 [Candidatus Pacearchaeota archaeon]|nr:hypothetical protein [Candidatus Pacearchaeota archaeon]
MKPEHYQQLSIWINDKIDSQRPETRAAYDKLGLPPSQYRKDLLLAINHSKWIQENLYPYCTDTEIDNAVERIINEKG